jgi:hydrogenase maturation protein HypF
MTAARTVRIRGVVQGVGFRPFVFRLASSNSLAGWVSNGEAGVEIFVEGPAPALEAFVRDLETQAPAAAKIVQITAEESQPLGFAGFTIRESHRNGHPTVRISPDLPVCPDCLAELFDPADPRYGYAYINCTNCGPRYSVVLGLPYDRENTTMKAWPLDHYCATQYGDPANRRFHAQPVACPVCGPHYYLRAGNESVSGDEAAIARAVELLNAGGIVAIKGIGGYHLACDARNAGAVTALRQRKYRKEKPFALMVKSLQVARDLVEFSPEAEQLITSLARPIVLARAKVQLPAIAPGNDEFGIMLPYTPLHHLIFAAGSPQVLVMTSANRSSEPIAYDDQEALRSLSGIADGFLIGERPIARRVDDSVARVGAFGPVILRRSRGYAPGAVATIPAQRSILAIGADLKNTVTLVVNGQAFMSQHIGDLEDYQSFLAFQQTIQDLVSMYEIDWDTILLAHDAHPEYRSTIYARDLPCPQTRAIQHHRAHIASVIAERGAWQTRVLGVSLDGTGYGDDGSIWGGEIFGGSVIGGFHRMAHLRAAVLLGGDAAARSPVQAAAGFIAQMDLADSVAEQLQFPQRYQQSLQLVRKGVRVFPTTSMGRLFDAAAAVLGFTRDITFEGQAAIWVEQLARTTFAPEPYPFPLVECQLDFRPLLGALIADRLRGRPIGECAAAFQSGVAHGLYQAMIALCEAGAIETIVLSGGVFQNELLMEHLKMLLLAQPLKVWTNRAVPPNDGGISLGQAALAAFDSSTQ